MASNGKSPLSERMQVTFDLYEMGEAMMRQNLRRRFPEESEAQIEERLVQWLSHRPGAEAGDAIGRALAWPPRGER